MSNMLFSEGQRKSVAWLIMVLIASLIWLQSSKGLFNYDEAFGLLLDFYWKLTAAFFALNVGEHVVKGLSSALGGKKIKLEDA